jgi:membrane-bound lytic murein transglycosylase D
LNPSLLRMSTPGDLPFDLHIPPGTKDVFSARLKDIPEEKRNSWRFHVVRAGETLDEIATSLHARASDIATANGLKPGETVDVDDELTVPVTVVASSGHPQRYTVRRGDTLITVADRFNVSVEDLRGWNHLSASSVKTGQSLNVAEPVRFPPSMRSRRAALHSKESRRTGATNASAHASAKTAGKSQSRASSPIAMKNAKGSSASSHASGSKQKHKAAR